MDDTLPNEASPLVLYSTRRRGRDSGRITPDASFISPAFYLHVLRSSRLAWRDVRASREADGIAGEEISRLGDASRQAALLLNEAGWLLSESTLSGDLSNRCGATGGFVYAVRCSRTHAARLLGQGYDKEISTPAKLSALLFIGQQLLHPRDISALVLRTWLAQQTGAIENGEGTRQQPTAAAPRGAVTTPAPSSIRSASATCLPLPDTGSLDPVAAVARLGLPLVPQGGTKWVKAVQLTEVRAGLWSAPLPLVTATGAALFDWMQPLLQPPTVIPLPAEAPAEEEDGVVANLPAATVEAADTLAATSTAPATAATAGGSRKRRRELDDFLSPPAVTPAEAQAAAAAAAGSAAGGGGRGARRTTATVAHGSPIRTGANAPGAGPLEPSPPAHALPLPGPIPGLLQVAGGGLAPTDAVATIARAYLQPVAGDTLLAIDGARPAHVEDARRVLHASEGPGGDAVTLLLYRPPLFSLPPATMDDTATSAGMHAQGSDSPSSDSLPALNMAQLCASTFAEGRLAGGTNAANGLLAAVQACEVRLSTAQRLLRAAEKEATGLRALARALAPFVRGGRVVPLSVPSPQLNIGTSGFEDEPTAQQPDASSLAWARLTAVLAGKAPSRARADGGANDRAAAGYNKAMAALFRLPPSTRLVAQFRATLHASLIGAIDALSSALAPTAAPVGTRRASLRSDRTPRLADQNTMELSGDDNGNGSESEDDPYVDRIVDSRLTTAVAPLSPAEVAAARAVLCRMLEGVGAAFTGADSRSASAASGAHHGPLNPVSLLLLDSRIVAPLSSHASLHSSSHSVSLVDALRAHETHGAHTFLRHQFAPPQAPVTAPDAASEGLPALGGAQPSYALSPLPATYVARLASGQPGDGYASVAGNALTVASGATGSAASSRAADTAASAVGAKKGPGASPPSLLSVHPCLGQTARGGAGGDPHRPTFGWRWDPCTPVRRAPLEPSIPAHVVSRLAHLATVTTASSETWCVAVDSSGRVAVTGDDDAMIGVWDARSGALQLNLRGFQHHVSHVAISPDNTCVAACSVDAGEDPVVRVWGLAGPYAPGQQAAVFHGHSGEVNALQWDPLLSGVLVTAGDDGTVRVWEVGAELNSEDDGAAHPTLYRRIPAPAPPASVASVTVSSAGMAVEDSTGVEEDEDVVIGPSRATRSAGAGAAASASGSAVPPQPSQPLASPAPISAATPESTTCCALQLTSPDCAGSSKVICLEARPSGLVVAVGSDDGTVTFIEIGQRLPAAATVEGVSLASESPFGDVFPVFQLGSEAAAPLPASDAGYGLLACPRILASARAFPASEVTAVSWSPPGDALLVSNFESGAVSLVRWTRGWANVATHRLPVAEAADAHHPSASTSSAAAVGSVVVPPSGVVWSADGASVFVAVVRRGPDAQVPGLTPFVSSKRSPTWAAATAASGSGAGASAGGASVEPSPLHAPSRTAVAPSREETALAAARDPHVQVWCARTGTCLRVLRGHSSVPWVLAPHPSDPSLLLSSGWDGRVIVHHVHSGHALARWTLFRDSQIAYPGGHGPASVAALQAANAAANGASSSSGRRLGTLLDGGADDDLDTDASAGQLAAPWAASPAHPLPSTGRNATSAPAFDSDRDHAPVLDIKWMPSEGGAHGCRHSSGLAFVATDVDSRLHFFGLPGTPTASALAAAPYQQRLSGDSAPLITGPSGYMIDQATQRPPHVTAGAQLLVDATGTPYPPRDQVPRCTPGSLPVPVTEGHLSQRRAELTALCDAVEASLPTTRSELLARLPGAPTASGTHSASLRRGGAALTAASASGGAPPPGPGGAPRPAPGGRSNRSVGAGATTTGGGTSGSTSRWGAYDRVVYIDGEYRELDDDAFEAYMVERERARREGQRARSERARARASARGYDDADDDDAISIASTSSSSSDSPASSGGGGSGRWKPRRRTQLGVSASAGAGGSPIRRRRGAASATAAAADTDRLIGLGDYDIDDSDDDDFRPQQAGGVRRRMPHGRGGGSEAAASSAAASSAMSDATRSALGAMDHSLSGGYDSEGRPADVFVRLPGLGQPQEEDQAASAAASTSHGGDGGSSAPASASSSVVVVNETATATQVPLHLCAFCGRPDETAPSSDSTSSHARSELLSGVEGRLLPLGLRVDGRRAVAVHANCAGFAPDATFLPAHEEERQMQEEAEGAAGSGPGGLILRVEAAFSGPLLSATGLSQAEAGSGASLSSSAAAAPPAALVPPSAHDAPLPPAEVRSVLGGRWFGLAKEVRRGRIFKCSLKGCGRAGATLGCSVPACHRSFHVRCAVLCGWQGWRGLPNVGGPAGGDPASLRAAARLVSGNAHDATSVDFTPFVCRQHGGQPPPRALAHCHPLTGVLAGTKRAPQASPASRTPDRPAPAPRGARKARFVDLETLDDAGEEEDGNRTATAAAGSAGRGFLGGGDGEVELGDVSSSDSDGLGGDDDEDGEYGGGGGSRRRRPRPALSSSRARDRSALPARAFSASSSASGRAPSSRRHQRVSYAEPGEDDLELLEDGEDGDERAAGRGSRADRASRRATDSASTAAAVAQSSSVAVAAPDKPPRWLHTSAAGGPARVNAQVLYRRSTIAWHRGWLSGTRPHPGSLRPQAGDEVVYIPQGHQVHAEEYRLPFPAEAWPRSASAVLCAVEGLAYAFPQHGKSGSHGEEAAAQVARPDAPSSGTPAVFIVAHITLRVVAVQVASTAAGPVWGEPRAPRSSSQPPSAPPAFGIGASFSVCWQPNCSEFLVLRRRYEASIVRAHALLRAPPARLAPSTAGAGASTSSSAHSPVTCAVLYVTGVAGTFHEELAFGDDPELRDVSTAAEEQEAAEGDVGGPRKRVSARDAEAASTLASSPFGLLSRSLGPEPPTDDVWQPAYGLGVWEAPGHAAVIAGDGEAAASEAAAEPPGSSPASVRSSPHATPADAAELARAWPAPSVILGRGCLPRHHLRSSAATEAVAGYARYFRSHLVRVARPARSGGGPGGWVDSPWESVLLQEWPTDDAGNDYPPGRAPENRASSAAGNAASSSGIAATQAQGLGDDAQGLGDDEGAAPVPSTDVDEDGDEGADTPADITPAAEPVTVSPWEVEIVSPSPSAQLTALPEAAVGNPWLTAAFATRFDCAPGLSSAFATGFIRGLRSLVALDQAGSDPEEVGNSQGAAAPQLTAFVDPVPLTYRDYHYTVPLPIDLTTILARLLHGWYRSTASLREDIALLVSNCEAFNAPGSDIVTVAQALGQRLDQLVDSLEASPAGESEQLGDEAGSIPSSVTNELS